MALAFARGDLYVILDEENIERIQQNDPFELDLAKMGSAVALTIPFKVRICYAKKSEYEQLQRLLEKGDFQQVWGYLARGFKITASDHDRGYDKYGTLEKK